MAEKIVLPNARYEPRDITGRGIIFALVLLVGSLATVGLVVWGLFPHSITDTRITEGVAAFPSPRLQPDPQEDWARFHRTELQQLNSFGWVDKANGIVRIPIDDAMRQVAARGIPGWPGAAGPKPK